MYGNADTEQFFGALADSAHDPRILAAMKSFVDQQGVPLVTFTRHGDTLSATQSRYAFLGETAPATRWYVPLCMRAGGERRCAILGETAIDIPAPAGAVVVPNAGGTGYWRFELPPADWNRLVEALPTLPSGEALAVDDSLWASFRAGHAPAAELIAEARAALGHPDSEVSLSPGKRLAGLRVRGLIEGPAMADYRRLMGRLYAPKLAAVGFDPAAGVYAQDPPDRQTFRQDLVRLVAAETDDTAVRERLAGAAGAYLKGDARALDQGFMGVAFGAYVLAGGPAAAQTLVEKALASEDPVFRSAAFAGAAASGRSDVATWLLGLKDPRVHLTERLRILAGLATTAETRDMAADWLLGAYDTIASGANGVFIGSQLPTLFSAQCSAARARQITDVVGPKVRAMGMGTLDLDRTVEAIGHCADLDAGRRSDLAAALAAAS
jgi:aminopeptidase N